MLGLLLAAFPAAATDKPTVEVSGHLKTFLVASFPYEELEELQTFEGPSGQAAADGRINLGAQWGPISFQLHHAITPSLSPASAGVGSIASTGVGVVAPEAVKLTWQVPDKEATDNGEAGPLVIRGRVDRLNLRGTFGPLDVTVGRQPISFGSGLFFTPLDLVNPFFPTTIDQEYKPGVDAVRADLFGSTSLLTVAAAYTCAEPDTDDCTWGLEDLSLAAYGQATLGVTDIGLFFGEIHADHVFGSSVASSAGPVGLHGDLTVTLPAEDSGQDDVFVRGVVGAGVSPVEDLNLSGEFYVQTLGTTDPEDYLVQLSGERYQRGELWLAGVYYAGLSASYSITPLVTGAVGLFGNLTDPSALLAPSVSWSVAGNAEVIGGMYMGLGSRPQIDIYSFSEPIALDSEFGLYPYAAFFQMRSYF